MWGLSILCPRIGTIHDILWSYFLLRSPWKRENSLQMKQCFMFSWPHWECWAPNTPLWIPWAPAKILSTTAELRLDALTCLWDRLSHTPNTPAQFPPTPNQALTTLEHESWNQTLHRGWTWSSHYCRTLLKSPSNKVGWFHRFHT